MSNKSAEWRSARIYFRVDKLGITSSHGPVKLILYDKLIYKVCISSWNDQAQEFEDAYDMGMFVSRKNMFLSWADAEDLDNWSA